MMTPEQAAEYGWKHARWELSSVLEGVRMRNGNEQQIDLAEIARNAEAAKRLAALEQAMRELMRFGIYKTMQVDVTKRADALMAEWGFAQEKAE